MRPAAARGLCLLFAAAAAIFGLAPAGASGATIAPNVFGDELTDNANCSLREAVSIANANSTATEPDCAVAGVLGADTIELYSEGAYRLEIAGEDSTNAAGDLDIDTTGGDLTIEGAGASQTRIDTDDTPGWTDRVLNQTTGSGTLTLSHLTVSGGDTTGLGGGIHAQAGSLVVQFARVTGNSAGNSGGGIRTNSGSTLSILDSTIDSNSNTGGTGGGGIVATGTTTIDSSAITGNTSIQPAARGGGIESGAGASNVTITDSLIAGNIAQSTDASAPAGGGVEVSNGTMTIRRTTISGNAVVGAAARSGGGINVFTPASLVVINSTVSGNEALGAGGSGGGVRVASGSATFAHTTFGPNPVGAAPSALLRASGTLNVRGSVVETSGSFAACSATITSQGRNVFTDSSCGALAAGDEVDADPMLGPLSNNGGPDAGAPNFTATVPSLAPAQASTVVDHVPAADCTDQPSGALTLDQRGLARPFDGDGDGTADCDAGAVELQTAPPAIPGLGSTPAPTSPAAPATPAAPKKCKKGQKLKKGKCVKKKRKKK